MVGLFCDQEDSCNERKKICLCNLHDTNKKHEVNSSLKKYHISFKYSTCDGTKPLTYSQPTHHTHTAITLRIELSREFTNTHRTHSIYRAPTPTFITQYQVQRKLGEYTRNSLSQKLHTLLLTASTAQDKCTEITVAAVIAK